MHRNEHTVEIERSAEEVFPWLVESDKRLRWLEKLVESRPLGDGAPGPGARFRDVFEDLGRRLEVDAELVDWRPPARAAVRLAAEPFVATVSHRLEEADGRTRLTSVVETEYRGLAVRLVSAGITARAQRQLEADLGRLKALLEGG